MATKSTASKNPVHVLHNNEYEDEADITAYTFTVTGPDTVVITPRYNGYPHKEIGQATTKAKAREQWRILVGCGFYETEATKWKGNT